MRRDTLQLQARAKLASLKAYDNRCQLVAHEIYRQQEEMWREKKHQIDDQIVSLSQPWVRFIVRGKASAKVEFGAKISVSVSEGDASLHRLSWDACHEGGDLVGQVESYRQRHAHYPESVHADKIYRPRANLQWCRQRGIRLSGPPLGRPGASDGGKRGRTGRGQSPDAAGRTGAHPSRRFAIQVEFAPHIIFVIKRRAASRIGSWMSWANRYGEKRATAYFRPGFSNKRGPVRIPCRRSPIVSNCSPIIGM